MNTDKESKSSWDNMADLYQEKFMELPIYNSFYDIFLDMLQHDNSTILDIACGPGNVSYYLLKRNPNLSITGIDYSENMIDLASINNPSAQFKILDLRDIQTLNTQYNGIVCGFGIPFLDETELEKFILDCSQLLSSGAPLYLSFEEGEYKNSGYKIGVDRNRVYFHYHSVKNLTKLFIQNGLKTPQVFRINFNSSNRISQVHTIVITEKQ